MSAPDDPSFWAKLAAHADQIPFLMAVATGSPKVQVSLQRVLEAAVIGVALAGIGYVMIIPRIEERMTIEFRQVRDDIGDLKRKVEMVEVQRNVDYRDLSDRINKVNLKDKP